MPPFICVICDGLPDRPLRVLGNRTPLEVAATPHLDRIARDGISGMMHSVDIGVRPGSDTAHLSLLGYDPARYYSGRGPFECVGIGMDLAPGDVAFRANAGTVDERGIVVDRRAGRIPATDAVIAHLGAVEISDVQVMLKPGLGHRLGMVLRGNNLSPRITDQDPHRTGVPLLEVQPREDTAAARFTADVCNEFSRLARERLRTMPQNAERAAAGLPPANAILFRGAGTIADGLQSFGERHGLRAAFVAGAPMYRGLAKILGLEVVAFAPGDGVTGKPDSNLEQKSRGRSSLPAITTASLSTSRAPTRSPRTATSRGKSPSLKKLTGRCSRWPPATSGWWRSPPTIPPPASSNSTPPIPSPSPSAGRASTPTRSTDFPNAPVFAAAWETSGAGT